MIQKLTEQQRAAIAWRLKFSPRDMAVGVLEAAVLYNTTVERIYQCTSPAKIKAGKVTLQLPPPAQVNGRRKLWRLGDLLASVRVKAPATSADPDPSAPSAADKPPVKKTANKKSKTMGRPRAS